MTTLILTGDVNLKGVTDPAVPLARVNGELRKGDLVFCNLECLLSVPPADHSHSNEGFFVAPDVGAKVLSRYCEDIEASARRADTEEARRIFAKIETEHGCVQKALTAESEQLAATKV